MCHHTVFSLTLLICSVLNVWASILNYLSYSDLEKQRDGERSGLWQPPSAPHLLPDFRPVQLCQDKGFHQLQHSLAQLVQKSHDPERFEWTSISLTTLEAVNRSFIILGGSAMKQSASSSVTPRDGGNLFICEFEIQKSEFSLLGFGPTKDACKGIFIPRDNGDEFLGASSSSLKISSDTSLLAYCDPLWRARSHVPVGRCFLNMLQNSLLKQSLELSEFCQSGMQAATPCMAGHSVAFMSSERNHAAGGGDADTLKSVQLWIGQPLSLPHGRVQIVNDPFGNATITTILRPSSTDFLRVGSHFGFSLTDGFVTAPAIVQNGVNQATNLTSVFGVQTFGEGTNYARAFGVTDWFGGLKSSDSFFGSGMSVIRITLSGVLDTAVVVGAPYYGLVYDDNDTTKTVETSANRGRIYLYCLNRKIQSVEPTQLSTPTDYLDGPNGSSFFGFSMSRLGDIDGDGHEDIAVGSPDLNNLYGYGQVFLVRVLPNCRFDSTAIQIIKGPSEALNFGAHLPPTAEDLDFNKWSDIVIPSNTFGDNKRLSSLQVYATRPRLHADCRFVFPVWLSIRRILIYETIPVQILVRFVGHRKLKGIYDPIESIYSAQSSGLLYHQVIGDWNASSGTQRFQLFDTIRSQVDSVQDLLIIDFELMANKDVQDMVDVDSNITGLFIGYRFLQPCDGNGPVTDEDGTCSGGGGLRRPLIDWSKCVTRVPITRFICYPHPACQSDISILVLSRTERRSAVGSSPDEGLQTSIEPNQQFTASKEIDLIFGDVDSSRPELLVELTNTGPTFAGGVSVELQFFGNLRYASLDVYETGADFERGVKINPKITVADNDTWVSCFIGSLPPPTIPEFSIKEASGSTTMYLHVLTYYRNFNTPVNADFTLGAAINISVITGTPDPSLQNNVVYVQYRVRNYPKIRISYGPRLVSSRMDNRTKPASWPVDFQRRIDVGDIGPRVEHSLQVEHLGPTLRLTNVTFRWTVPSELSPQDQLGERDAFLVYLFREIRATTDASDGLQWVDLWPKVTSLDERERGRRGRLGTCAITNSEQTVNPKKLIGMDVTQTYSRSRRHASHAVSDAEYEVTRDPLDNISWDEANDSTFPMSDNPEISATSSGPGLFRRIPKEILQCDRVGYRLQKPTCAQIVCRLDELQKNRPVLISMTGWIWARTLFDKHISDIDLVTTLTVDQGAIPVGVLRAEEPVGHFHLTQTFFFPQIRPKLIHQIPTWPIVVGIVLGILFLTLLIVLLYCLGFFKRRRPALKKARFSKGGADELERNDLDTEVKPNDRMAAPQTAIHRHGMGVKKKQRGKHRSELTILHPADIAASNRQAQDTVKLLDESSPSTTPASHFNNGTTVDS